MVPARPLGLPGAVATGNQLLPVFEKGLAESVSNGHVGVPTAGRDGVVGSGGWAAAVVGEVVD